MATNEDDAPGTTISDDAARGGVTGHHVIYVLAWGLTGVIAAFAALAVYFGYDGLQDIISRAFARNSSDVLRALAPYGVVILVAAIAVGLLLGAWTLIAGSSESATQTGMRIRVVTQLVLVCVIMAIMYLASG